jgi:hypothetical protein
MEKRSHENSWLQKYLGGCLFMMSISLERKQPSLNHMRDLLEVEYISLEYVYHGVCKTPEANIATLKIWGADRQDRHVTSREGRDEGCILPAE